MYNLCIFYKKYDEKLRENIKLSYDKKNKNIENFIRKNLHRFIPICFVESFKNIFENCEKSFPSKPKFIITGVNHDFNEIFKSYTAKKVNEGVPYFTLQHGATYFTEDFVLNRCEYETSDKFFTFGHSKETFCESFGNINVLGKQWGLYPPENTIRKNEGNLFYTKEPYNLKVIIASLLINLIIIIAVGIYFFILK